MFPLLAPCYLVDSLRTNAMSGKAHDNLAVAHGAQAARLAIDVLPICRGTNHDTATGGSEYFLLALNLTRQHCHNGANATIGQCVRVWQVIA